MKAPETFGELRENNPILAEIIREQFKTFDIDVQDDEDLTGQWFWRHEWTLQQEADFKKWAFDYLCKIPMKDLRRFIGRQYLTKKIIRAVAYELVSEWGFLVPNRYGEEITTQNT